MPNYKMSRIHHTLGAAALLTLLVGAGTQAFAGTTSTQLAPDSQPAPAPDATQCATRNPLPMQINLKHHTLYVINEDGQVDTTNLWEKSLDYSVGPDQDAVLFTIDPEPNSPAIAGKMSIYAGDTHQRTEPLPVQADESGLQVLLQPRSDTSYSFNFYPASNTDNEQPVPKLVLKPVETCPPRPPPPGIKK